MGWTLQNLIDYERRQDRAKPQRKSGQGHDSVSRQDPDPQRHPAGLIVEETTDESCVKAPVLVRFTHVRKRLADSDNLNCKVFLDMLRQTTNPATGECYLPGDAPHQVEVSHRQRKTRANESEHIVCEIFYA